MNRNSQRQVLKRLALEYKSSRKQSAFCKILKRVEGLIIHTIVKFLSKRTYLQGVDLQEYYNAAVLGLYNALNTVKESESGDQLIARFVVYMRDEMTKVSSETVKKSAFYTLSRDDAVSEESVYRNLESEFLRERFQKFIDDGVISSEEFNLLVMKFVDEMTYKDIAKEVNRTYTWVSTRISNSLNRIRWELRRRGFEEV
ncbi:MAG: sigma-70 family RNA polymerase sigma factor [Candidatus Thorarchaeota archaeon]